MLIRIWNDVWKVLQKTWEGWQADDGFLLSAAMAYYAAFSLFPLCLVLISILGFVLHFSKQAVEAQAMLLDQVRQQCGTWLADQLQALLAGVQSSAGLGGPLGAITLLAAAIVVFLQLDYMFGRIFATAKASSTISVWGYVRTVLYDRLTAFLMLLAVGGLLLGLFVVNVSLLAAIRMNVEKWLPGGVLLWGWTHFLFIVATNALLFGLIYKVLPKTTIRWRDALPAASLSRWSGSLAAPAGDAPHRPGLHGLRRRWLVHRGDDLGLLCQCHPLSRHRVRRGPLDRRWPEPKAGRDWRNPDSIQLAGWRITLNGSSCSSCFIALRAARRGGRIGFFPNIQAAGPPGRAACPHAGQTHQDHGTTLPSPNPTH